MSKSRKRKDEQREGTFRKRNAVRSGRSSREITGAPLGRWNCPPNQIVFGAHTVLSEEL